MLSGPISDCHGPMCRRFGGFQSGKKKIVLKAAGQFFLASQKLNEVFRFTALQRSISGWRQFLRRILQGSL